nr:unnamed protein product [Callosobruchus chinensis]
MDSSDCKDTIITVNNCDKPYKCSYEGCNASFKKNALLNRHILKHTGERPYSCDIAGCNASFQQIFHLKRHKLSVHNQSERYVCDEENCSKIFTNSFSFKKHKARIHAPRTLHKCSQCLKGYKKKYQLRNHILSHGKTVDGTLFFRGKGEKGQRTPKNPLRCSFEGCRAIFTKFSYFTLHMRKHTGERPFVCDVEGCDKCYVNSYHLKRHKIKAHETKKEYICQEKDCGMVLSDEHTLQRHTDRCHSFNGPYKCMHCMKGFYQKRVLRKHLAAHREESSNLKCNKCNVVFPNKTNYLKHMNCHKSYTCDCGKVFERWLMWMRHKRDCYSQKTDHICTVCNKSFSTYSKLRQHSIAHSEAKEIFKCPFVDCDRSYNYKKNLMFHIYSFHEQIEEEICKCPFSGCTTVFKKKQYMKRHVKNKHINPKPKKTAIKPRKDKGIPKSNSVIAMSGLNPVLKKSLEKDSNGKQRSVVSKESSLSKDSAQNKITTGLNVADARRNVPPNVAVDMLEVCYSTENSRESSVDEFDANESTLNTEANANDTVKEAAIEDHQDFQTSSESFELDLVSKIQ